MAQDTDVEKVDVVVVGAGIAGLRAATLIARTGKSVVVVEAKERVGGRTHTVQVTHGDGAQSSWDLGGQWVSTAQPRMMSLLSELGLKHVKQFASGTKFLQLPDGKVLTYSGFLPTSLSLPVLADLGQGLFRMENKCSAVASGIPRDVAEKYDGLNSLELYKETFYTDTAIAIITAACQVIFGEDLKDIGGLYGLTYLATCGGIQATADDTDGAAQEFKIDGGSQQVSEKMAEKLDVRVSAPVTRIQHDEHGVTVTAKGLKSAIRGSMAVLACAPCVLENIEVSPPFPADRQQLHRDMKMGSLNKVIVLYEKAFWRDSDLSGEMVSCTGPLANVWDGVNPEGRAALVCFLGGDLSRDWHSKEPEKRKEAVLEHLCTFFGDQARHPTHYLEKLWPDEEYVGGCPTGILRENQIINEGILRQPVGRILFCGTETATSWRGYMEGAVESAERVASEVAARFDDNSAPLPADQHSKIYDTSSPVWISIVKVSIALAVAAAAYKAFA